MVGRLFAAWAVVTSAAVAQAAEPDWPDCGQVTAQHEIVKTTCVVRHLRELRGGSMSSWGAANVCAAGCGSAMKALSLSATDCTAAELDTALSIADARQHLRAAELEQAKCAPPSLQCYRTFRDMVNYERSSVGQTCSGFRADADAEPNAALGQAKSQAFCHGACGVNASRYLKVMEDDGCVQWDAYRNAKLTYDTACGVASSDRYCANEFNLDKFRADIDSVLANAGPVTARESMLADICTPCFQEHIRMVNRYSTLNPDRLLVLEKICVRDGDRFCYPRFNERDAATTTSSVNARAQSLCDVDYMGRCASKLQTREMIRLQHTSPDSTRITELKNSIDTMCLVQPAAAVGGSPTLCADVMQSIVGGYNYSDKTYHGTTYQGPGQCAAVVNGTACNWLCQKEFTTERNSFGCCYYSMKAYFEKQNFTDLIGVYSRSDVLANECNRPPEPQCTEFEQGSEGSASITLEVPLRFIEANETRARKLVLADIMRATGLTTSALTVKGFRYVSQTTSGADITIIGTDAGIVQAAVADVVTMQANGAIVNLATERAYNLECHETGGAACSGSSVASAKLVTVLTGVLAWTLAAA